MQLPCMRQGLVLKSRMMRRALLEYAATYACAMTGVVDETRIKYEV